MKSPPPGVGSEIDTGDDAATESIYPEPGRVLFDRYLVEKRIGQGGMGSVWLVKHLELDTHRALKLIVSYIASDPQARARFKREARVMARLSHPNAVMVHDARLAKGSAFIEMEYVPGQSLNQVLTPGQPMPLDWTARILEQLCDVLQVAHDQGIVHRDLKPSNLMLVAGRPPGKELLKVLDFGIAKILNPDDLGPEDPCTRTGALLFTPQYGSPEQATGGKVDTRSDLYSVGVILYELLTGHRPFSGPEITYQHILTPPPRFAERNPNVVVPPEVEQLVLRLLAKKPDERPQSPRELLAEFQRALELHTNVMEPSARGQRESDPRTQPMSAVAHAPDMVARRGLEPTQPFPTPASPATVPPEAKPGRAGSQRRLAVWLLAPVPVAVIASALLAWRWFHPPDTRADLLPSGFVAEASETPGDGPPRALVRQADGARFLRIAGGSFVMGDDFDNAEIGPDDDRPSHPVELSDFYMQETEVTNAMMDAFFRATKVRPENRPPRWREACTPAGGARDRPRPLPGGRHPV